MALSIRTLIDRLRKLLIRLVSAVSSFLKSLLDLLTPENHHASGPQYSNQTSYVRKGVDMRYQIRGMVIDKKRKRVPGVRVEVWDTENVVGDYLTYAATSGDGSFVINIDDDMIRDLFPNRFPDLYFKVWCGDELLASTEDSVVWNSKSHAPKKIVVGPIKPLQCRDRHIYLKIERIEGYSPVMPQDHTVGQAEWGRDCMRNEGHEDGRIPQSEIDARALDAVVYREYLDSAFLIPKPDKLILADINEPLYEHRVPGTVIYARPCQRLKIHVWNDDDVPHSLHVHGLRYGIDSDGTWPFGTQASNLGGRSDAICPGDTWIYTFDITNEMYGAWPFHDYTHHSNVKIEQGLFGGIVVLSYCDKPPRPFRFRRGILAEVYDAVEKNEGRDFLPKDRRINFDEALPPFIFDRQIHFKRLKPESQEILHHRLHFVEEYVNAEVALPTKHIPTDHVPIFFHKMTRRETPEPPAKPPFERPPFDLNLEAVLVQQRQLLNFAGLLRPPFDLVINPDLVPLVPLPPREVEAITSLCINGRTFVGNTPTIVGRAGQRIRWYVFNLDVSSNGHNFHAHGMRWRFAGETIDTRSLGPGESFVVEATIPPVLLLTEQQARIQQPLYRPRNAKLFCVKGDFLFHCHEQEHLLGGMAGLVRSRQSVWLTQQMADDIRRRTGLPLCDGGNACPEVEPDPCGEERIGHWEEVAGRPEVLLMHSVLLPNTKRVLFWGRTRADQSRIWDYSTPTGAYSTPANQPADLVGGNTSISNMWSASHCLLDTPEGIVLIHGGLSSTSAFTFNPATETWAQVNDTVGNRFYATTLVLADGRAPTLFGNVETIEIYTHGANWGAPIAVDPSMFHHQFYPWTYLLRDGRVFIAGPHVPSQRFDITNPAAVESFNSIRGDRSTAGGEKGSSVLLILRPPDYEAIVYRMGGNEAALANSAEEINLTVPSPAWADLPDIQNARANQFTATLLPDGRVFIAGGIGTPGDPDGGPCEIFDPQNPAAGWIVGPTMRFVRTYHSSFILLQDGSILGGGAPPDADNENDYTEHERFFPGYFDRVRPVITGAPATINYGGNFDVNTPTPLDISEVVLLRAGAVTHGFNMSQRGIELVIAGTGPGTLNVEAPPEANLAPPGWYLMFILNFDRTPSEGRWIRVTT